MKAVRSFLGLYNYVRIFCYYVSTTAEPLNTLLKKSALFDKTEEYRLTFENIKKLVYKALVLAFFKPNRLTKVEIDASRNVTGGVI